MFKTMSGRDVVVRLLDPPLHEFLDNPRELEVAITKKEAAGASEEELAALRARLRRIDGMVSLRNAWVIYVRDYEDYMYLVG